MDDSTPRSAADLVARFVESIGATDNAGLIPFFSNWTDIVGTDLAAHSAPIDLRHGSLIVQVDHPGWAQRLAIKSRDIQAVIRRRYPQVTVRNIHSYVSDGPVGAPSRDAGSTHEVAPVRTPEEESEGAAEVAPAGAPDEAAQQLPTPRDRAPNEAAPREAAPPSDQPTTDSEFSSSLERLGRAIAKKVDARRSD